MWKNETCCNTEDGLSLSISHGVATGQLIEVIHCICSRNNGNMSQLFTYLSNTSISANCGIMHFILNNRDGGHTFIALQCSSYHGWTPSSSRRHCWCPVLGHGRRPNQYSPWLSSSRFLARWWTCIRSPTSAWRPPPGREGLARRWTFHLQGIQMKNSLRINCNL